MLSCQTRSVLVNSLTSATSTQNVIDDDQGLNCTYLFSSLSSLSWWHKYVSPFAMSDFSNEKKSVLERTWLQKVIETVHQSGALLLPCVALGPLFYSNVFNSKSNVTVTLSEHVDGNFQARCGQRLQSTNHVILRATISPWLVRREA